MKKMRYIFVSFFATLIFSSVFIDFAIAKTNTEKEKKVDSTASRLESLTKLTKVIGTVEQYYVDDIVINEVINKAIDGLLSNLDAHSSFLNTKKFQELKIQTDGEFGGLGITVGMKNGALTVIAPIEGTPADKAGLEAGDIILKINNKSTLNMTIDEAVAIMRGKPKTKIDVTIVRKDKPKPFVVTIIRDIIKIQSVYSKKIDKDILYVRVTSFDKNVISGVKNALKDNPKATGMILDLRNNPGGLLDQAVGLVDLFVNKGIIVSQKGRIENEDRVFNASSYGTFKDIPIVVLINGGSASASEIVSGSLQDHKRAVIVGEKTFGKGSVQVILPINKKEAIRLTIARYYLPSGRTIQAVGVTPDVSVYPGKVPHEINEFSIKEAELKKHLKGELEKVSNNKNDIIKKEDNNETDNKIITEKQLFNDMQLKSGVDILKALMIIPNNKIGE